jgi:hypothetical protein
MKKNKLKETVVKFKVKNKKVQFIVYQNLFEFFEPAIICWLARTNKYTKESLCEYINEKQTEHRCEIKQDYGNI